MKRSVCLTLLVLMTGAGFDLASQTAPKTDVSVRAALFELTTDSDSYRDLVAARDFSLVLQTQLGSLPDIQWVERAELTRLQQELALTALGAGDPANQIRAGRWLKADLLRRGEACRQFTHHPTKRLSDRFK